MSKGRPKKWKFVVAITNDDSMEPTPKISNVIRCENQQPEPSFATIPIRANKDKVIAKVSEVIKTRFDY